MVQSFGDGRRVNQEPGEVDPEEIPGQPAPGLYGAARFMLVFEPMLDDELLAEVAEKIRATVAQAFADGMADAMAAQLELVPGGGDEADRGEMGAQLKVPPAGDVEAPAFDANPTVNSKDPYAHAKYAERLDRQVPGWWREMPRHAASELVLEARKRAERERERAVPVPGR